MIKALMCAVAITLPLAAFAEQPTMDKQHNMFVDEHGMTLYTFDKDEAGQASNCKKDTPCMTNWPAAIADDYDKPSGDWTLVDADGKKQWAYKGHRVYRFAKDAKPGDKKGDGVMKVWHIAKP